ncbi:MAG: hypothetical protein ACYTXT_44090 [Nostoc sp.]
MYKKPCLLLFIGKGGNLRHNRPSLLRSLIRNCDRSYGTAIASSLDKLDITSIAETAAAYFYAIIAGVRNVKVPLRLSPVLKNGRMRRL